MSDKPFIKDCQNDTPTEQAERAIVICRRVSGNKFVQESVIFSQGAITVNMEDGSYKSIKSRKKRVIKDAMKERRGIGKNLPTPIINNTIIENNYLNNTTQVAVLPRNTIQGYIPTL